MNYSLSMIFIIFMFYAIVGWIVECIDVLICIKKLMNRGFLIGPYCPIYGAGCLIFILTLHKYLNDPVVLFILAITICSVMEYVTSWLMEKVFKARWWDYSHKKFNLNGRICLNNMLGFGAGALFVMYVSHPLLFPVLEKIPSNILNIIAIILFIIFATDIIISFKVISNFKNVAKSIKKDSTEEITKKVKENLMSRGGLYKRLVSSFDFEASDNLLSNLKARVKNEKVKAKKKVADEKKKIKLQDKKQRLKRELKSVKNEINHK